MGSTGTQTAPVFWLIRIGYLVTGQAQHPARPSKAIKNNILHMKGFLLNSVILSGESLNLKLLIFRYSQALLSIQKAKAKRFQRDYKREKSGIHSKRLDALLMEVVNLLGCRRAPAAPEFRSSSRAGNLMSEEISCVSGKGLSTVQIKHLGKDSLLIICSQRLFLRINITIRLN